uniref:Uncharacterized protein n=1 Tax=Knipowitschia caucasica TaxID=637954 RepID=A0AAV2KEN1_KNICA
MTLRGGRGWIDRGERSRVAAGISHSRQEEINTVMAAKSTGYRGRLQITSPRRHRDVTETSPRRHRDVTETSPRRHRDVTETSPRRHRDVTEASPRRHRDVTETSPRRHRDVTETSPRRHRDVTETSPRRHRDVTETSPRRHRDVTETSPRGHRDVTEASPRRHRDVTETSPRRHQGQVAELLAALTLAVAAGGVETQLFDQNQRLLTQVFIPVARHPPISIALAPQPSTERRRPAPRADGGRSGTKCSQGPPTFYGQREEEVGGAGEEGVAWITETRAMEP